MEAFGVGAEPIARRIRDAASNGTLSHALLLTGRGDLRALARYAAAAYECTASGERPCGICPDCRKILRGVHPDVATVADPERKFLSADVVRAARSDAWTRPNEGARKVYIFPDCALLTPQDQNILLKVVEEGPPYAAFVFCAENASMALQTLRSRCVELKTRPTEEAVKTDAAERGEELCRRVLRGRGAVAEMTTRLEGDKKKFTRDELREMLTWGRGAFAAALFLGYGRPAPPEYVPIARDLAQNLDRKRLLYALDRISAYDKDCASTQVGVGYVLGALAADLEEL